MAQAPCPVCRSVDTEGFVEIGGRGYLRCGRCEARFLEPAHRLGREEEHAHYAHHQNDPDDPRYRAFLSKLSTPLLARLPEAGSGLDFGSGAGSAMAAVLREAGHRMALYDPAFAAEAAVLDQRYDMITCTEVIEHLHDPAGTFELFEPMLRPGGWLGLMTVFAVDDSDFAGWYYRRDPTHVVFYRRETLNWIADRLGWSCEIPEPNVALMRKPLP